MVMARGLSRALKSSRSDQVSKAVSRAEQEQRDKAMRQQEIDRATEQIHRNKAMQQKTAQLAAFDDQRRAMKQAEDAKAMAMQNEAKAMMGAGPQMPAAPSTARPPTMSPQGMNRAPVGLQRPAPMSSPPAGMQPRSLAPRGPGMPPGFKKGGSVSSASKRGDGIAQRGKTKGRYL
jgi:hypothetical protein